MYIFQVGKQVPRHGVCGATSTGLKVIFGFKNFSVIVLNVLKNFGAVIHCLSPENYYATVLAGACYFEPILVELFYNKIFYILNFCRVSWKTLTEIRTFLREIVA